MESHPILQSVKPPKPPIQFIQPNPTQPTPTQSTNPIQPAVNSTADIRRFFGLDDDTTDLPTAVFSDMRSATQETPQGEQFLFGQTSYGFGGGGLTVENLQRFAREGLDGELGGGGGGGGKKKKKKAKKGVKTSSAKGKKLASEL